MQPPHAYRGPPAGRAMPASPCGLRLHGEGLGSERGACLAMGAKLGRRWKQGGRRRKERATAAPEGGRTQMK